jgi:cytochrome c553
MRIPRLRDTGVGAAIFIAILIGTTLISAPVTAAQNSSGDKIASTPAQTTPAWAYPLDAPGVKFTPMTSAMPADQRQPRANDDTLIHLPGSDVALSLNQVRHGGDWHPGDHPVMPEIVANGRRPEVLGCSFCHVPNGQGRPESSRLAGLPASYMAEQIANFKNGVRKSAEPRSVPPTLMVTIAKNVTDDEIKIAVQYYSSLTYRPWIRVVESATAPKTRLAGGILIPVEPQMMEPIGNRIIEVPESVERTALHDSESGFVAYVPIGSVKRGERLVTAGGDKAAGGKIVAGKTIRCGVCHGADLKGLGNIPGIAGASASYAARQLYDFQRGTRGGPGAELMKAVVANLTEEDLVSIVAYTASRTP